MEIATNTTHDSMSIDSQTESTTSCNSNSCDASKINSSIDPFRTNPNLEKFFHQIRSQMDTYSIHSPEQNTSIYCDKTTQFSSEEICHATETCQQINNKPNDENSNQLEITPLSSNCSPCSFEVPPTIYSTVTTPQQETEEIVTCTAVSQFVSEKGTIHPSTMVSIPLEQLIYEKLTRSVLPSNQLIKIPPIVQDLYGLTTISIPLSQGVTLSLPLEQEFRSINQCVTFWDLKTLQLLAFEDNFVHYIGRSKEELLQGNFTLIETTTPNARAMAAKVMEKFLHLGVKTLELDAGFYRECDGRVVFLYHKMYFEKDCIRMEHFLGKGSHDGFILDGKVFPKFLEASTMLQGSAQESFLTAKGTRLLQAL